MNMNQYRCIPLISQGANDIIIPLGFCPDVVRLTQWATGLEAMWYRLQGNDSSITCDAVGAKTVQGGMGVILGSIPAMPHGEAMTADTDFTAFTDVNWAENGLACNAIQLTADLVTLAAANALVTLEAWGTTEPIIRSVHDGGASNTFWEDGSIDFEELGVCAQRGGACTWILINQSNGNYAYISDIQRVPGAANPRRCRLILAENRAGDPTAAAAIADADVAFILPIRLAQYPLGDIGLMT